MNHNKKKTFPQKNISQRSNHSASLSLSPHLHLLSKKRIRIKKQSLVVLQATDQWLGLSGFFSIPSTINTFTNALMISCTIVYKQKRAHWGDTVLSYLPFFPIPCPIVCSMFFWRYLLRIFHIVFLAL